LDPRRSRTAHPRTLTFMARLLIRESNLILHLNWLEHAADLSLRNPTVPLSAIRRTDVIKKPWSNLLKHQTDFGYRGNTAPLRAVVTLWSRGAARNGGLAAVVVYLNRPSVVVRLAPNVTPWRLIVFSSGHAEELAQAIRDAITDVESTL
jgi:hypothetical protein